MPKKISKYVAIDGREFDTFDQAFNYERTLKVIEDVKMAILDVMKTTIDDQGRRVYQTDTGSFNTFADMLVTTQLFDNLKAVLTKK